MKAHPFALSLVGLLAALPASAAKHIVISDSLLANSEEWQVKRGGHWGGIHKWRFGGYAVVDSKLGWTRSSTHSNFFKTRVENHTGSTFSFVLSSTTTDSAFVDAVHDIQARSHPGLKVGDGLTIGGDDQVHESDQFTAAILVNRDTTDAWVLSVGSAQVTRPGGDGVGTHEAVLTQGERNIVLSPVFSKKLSEHPSLGSMLKLQVAPPAMGYEFIEDGRSLCALEYFSSSISGSYKNTVWMRRDTDARMRLVLAAAMTAVLQLECTAIEGEAGAPAEK